MNAKIAVAIALLATFAFSTIAITRISPVSASGGSSSTVTFSSAELMLPEFTKEWGPGTLTLKTDLAGPGVQFDFTGLTSAETGVGDNFAVNVLAGGVYKDYGYGFAGYYDFSGYKRYSLVIENVGADSVDVCLFFNTGWTGDWSGGQWTGLDGFGASPSRDTAWRSDYVSIAPTETKTVSLDFSGAICNNAGDDPVAAWRYPDGTSGVTVRRLDELSNIGFQVMGNGAGSIVVLGTQLYIDPPEVSKAPGDVDSFFDVHVTLENFANFAGFDLHLTWDGTMITRTGVDYTTALDALWGAGNYMVPIETSGTGFYKIVAVALATSATNTGASVLFTLTFRIDRCSNFPLSTPIHFDVVKLSDDTAPVPDPIIAAVTDGMYYISGAAPDLEVELVDPDPNPTVALADAELMLSEFTTEWGPGTLALKTDLAEPGVQFDFTGLVSTDGTCVGDNFPVNVLAGGAYKNYGYGFAGYYDFSGYQRYCMVIENVGTESVGVCLFVNTGWTGDWSGGQWIGSDGYPASPARDTYWQGGWVFIGPAEVTAVCLDFASATCYNAGDDPRVDWQYPDGTPGVPVRRLDELTNIGFQVLGNGAGSVVVKETQLYAEYCTTFQVSVYATHIWATLKDYDLSILYSADLLAFVEVDTWGVLGGPSDQADVDSSVPGVLHLWDTGGVTWTGDKGLLFTLTFHVEFDDRAAHIWRTSTQPNLLVAQITLQDATLSFEEGTIPFSGITVIGSPLAVTIHLVRGDVDCNGEVSLLDLRTIAYYYDVEQGDPQWADAAKYDLNTDNAIDLYDLVIVATNYGYPY